MIKDYQHKNVLAEMKRQVNAAAKISDREARITFVLVHMISEHHELAESAGKPDGENNLFRFVTWCLSRFAEELETPSTEDFKNPIDLFKKEQDINLLNLARFHTPAKNAVEKDLDESLEWPKDVPYEEWEEDMLQTAYATMFGLYFFDTPAKDLMRWLGKDEPKNYRFVNAMNRHETALNVSEERTRLREADGPLPWKKKQKRMYVSDEEMAQGKEHVDQLHQGFLKLVEMLGTGDVLRFCHEKEDAAFGIFMTGTFAMMMPGKNINRKGMVSSRDNAKLVYQAAKKSLMGDKLSKQIVTAADDKAAAEVFYWGLVYGEQGVADGSMPTGMADIDIRRKPKPKLKN
ncbi:MAG: hypothetical protein IKH01_00020 [Prevotella sp.]|nr:hypothetical protein [Prevotella sp.]